ncbi:unnamed protein product [Amoebophrya sp. A120]|nr:unnamed protein product [Amoebophrya sp. A120]|eukprot:GSA120T00001531001.1
MSQAALAYVVLGASLISGAACANCRDASTWQVPGVPTRRTFSGRNAAEDDGVEEPARHTFNGSSRPSSRQSRKTFVSEGGPDDRSMVGTASLPGEPREPGGEREDNWPPCPPVRAPDRPATHGGEHHRHSRAKRKSNRSTIEDVFSDESCSPRNSFGSSAAGGSGAPPAPGGPSTYFAAQAAAGRLWQRHGSRRMQQLNRLEGGGVHQHLPAGGATSSTPGYYPADEDTRGDWDDERLSHGSGRSSFSSGASRNSFTSSRNSFIDQKPAPTPQRECVNFVSMAPMALRPVTATVPMQPVTRSPMTSRPSTSNNATPRRRVQHTPVPSPEGGSRGDESSTPISSPVPSRPPLPRLEKAHRPPPIAQPTRMPSPAMDLARPASASRSQRQADPFANESVVLPGGHLGRCAENLPQVYDPQPATAPEPPAPASSTRATPLIPVPKRDVAIVIPSDQVRVISQPSQPAQPPREPVTSSPVAEPAQPTTSRSLRSRKLAPIQVDAPPAGPPEAEAQAATETKLRSCLDRLLGKAGGAFGTSDNPVAEANGALLTGSTASPGGGNNNARELQELAAILDVLEQDKEKCRLANERSKKAKLEAERAAAALAKEKSAEDRARQKNLWSSLNLKRLTSQTKPKASSCSGTTGVVPAAASEDSVEEEKRTRDVARLYAALLGEGEVDSPSKEEVDEFFHDNFPDGWELLQWLDEKVEKQRAEAAREPQDSEELWASLRASCRTPTRQKLRKSKRTTLFDESAMGGSSLLASSLAIESSALDTFRAAHGGSVAAEEPASEESRCRGRFTHCVVRVRKMQALMEHIERDGGAGLLEQYRTAHPDSDLDLDFLAQRAGLSLAPLENGSGSSFLQSSTGEGGQSTGAFSSEGSQSGRSGAQQQMPLSPSARVWNQNIVRGMLLTAKSKT